jgi:DNA ligase-1
MKFQVLVEYSGRLRSVTSRNEKVNIIVDFLKDLSKREAAFGVKYISGVVRQGKLNIAWKGLSELLNCRRRKLDSPSLIQIDEYLNKTRSAKGRDKISVLLPLFERLSKQERKYLISLIVGEVQQGAGEGLVKLAIAKFFDLSDEEIERAYLQKPDIGELFAHLLIKGKAGTETLGIRLFSPVKPMLAQIAESIDDVFIEYDDFALEYKLDGVRIQVHRKEDEVRIFSSLLENSFSMARQSVSMPRERQYRFKF